MKHNNQQISGEYIQLVEIMRKLRSPDGCSWDRKQTMAGLADNVIEEANEVVEAIKSGDSLHICEELGDLLMMVVFQTQIAAEEGKFDMADVARGICSKLINRHPHVFGEHENAIDPDKVVEMWGEIKKQEKLDRSRLSNRMREAMKFPSALSGAEKVQSEAASIGFDFANARTALAKIHEEALEIEKAMSECNPEEIEEELGDLLFSVLNVSRLSNVSAEKSLRKATAKFVERFAQIEPLVEADGGFAGKSLEELDRYWDKIKLQK
ncbi:MAG: nucleoside triphosphate pyrophosphohydrolase [Candidatus Riflebacteria bacterium]|nr:nucleoside triphosphate pyrophosphohydrolase [Candidatus Riflebacteria bacterium]